MKFPDPLRALCRQIVARHLPAEREVFELCGDQLLDQLDPDLRDVGPERAVGDAEFGRSLDELEIVAVAETMQDLAAAVRGSRKPPAGPDLETRWRKALIGRGLDRAAATAIAGEFTVSLLAYALGEPA